MDRYYHALACVDENGLTVTRDTCHLDSRSYTRLTHDSTGSESCCQFRICKMEEVRAFQNCCVINVELSENFGEGRGFAAFVEIHKKESPRFDLSRTLQNEA